MQYTALHSTAIKLYDVNSSGVFIQMTLNVFRRTLVLCESPRTMKNNQTATSTIACRWLWKLSWTSILLSNTFRSLLRERSQQTLSDSTATVASQSNQAPNSFASDVFPLFFASMLNASGKSLMIKYGFLLLIISCVYDCLLLVIVSTKRELMDWMVLQYIKIYLCPLQGGPPMLAPRLTPSLSSP